MTVTLNFAAAYAQFLNQSEIEHCVLTTLDHQEISTNSDLSILVDDDVRIQQLNREFMGIDAPTDVLAFPAGHHDPDTNRVYLGDVIVSYPQAKQQAVEAGHSFSAEISLLIIHGVLHLLGHDHDQLERRAKMWSAQNEILTRLGLEIKSPEFSSYFDV